MKNLMKSYFSNIARCVVMFALVFTVLFGVTPQKAEAASPILTLSNAGNSQVRIEVTGDVNSSVYLYFYNPPNSGSIQSAGVIGSTNSSGYFSTTVGSTAYGIPVGSGVFVNVNNQQSSSVMWPTITGGNIYLSQTSISMYAGQNTSISISGGTGTYYVSSNSNSNVASASISGSLVTVNAINGGNTTFTICSASVGTSCASLYVTVNGGTYYGGQSIYFSPTSANVQAGQVQSVNVYGSGSYYLSNNSNPSVASVTISGTVLNITGLTNGSTVMTICSQTSSGYCGSLNVTVYTSYNNGYYNGTYYNNYCNGYYYNGNCNSNFTSGSYYSNTYYPNTYYPNNYSSSYTYTQPATVYVDSQPTIVRAQTYGKPVSGVYLNQLPATGLKFNLKLILFIVGLFLWSAAVAYFIINSHRNRSKMTLGYVSTTNGQSNSHAAGMTKAELFKMKRMNGYHQ